MSEIKYGNFKKQVYSLQTNTIATRRNFTDAFSMNAFKQKQLCQSNAREYCIKEDFNQNGSRIISLNIKQYQRFLQL